MLKKYQLSSVVTISLYTEVEANSLEDAIRIAKNRHIEVYHLMDTEQASEAWVSEEFDGEPYEIRES